MCSPNLLPWSIGYFFAFLTSKLLILLVGELEYSKVFPLNLRKYLFTKLIGNELASDSV